MQPFTKHTGLVAPLDRVNVDTDQMVPKQFLKALTRSGFGKNLFYDWRYLPGEIPNSEFVLNLPRYKGASILLGRQNFACGSSREHAVWAVQDYGFRVVIAPSFGDIFYNNCFKNGVLPIRLPEGEIDELFRMAQKDGLHRLTVDLESQTITDSQGRTIHFDIDPSRREVLLKGLDDIGVTMLHEERITQFENRTHPSAPLYDPAAIDMKVV
jgi:3-isopropylmalate/(R)-2-methylmalate dehydratase small subunit